MDSDVLVKVEGVSKKFCRDLKRSLWYGVKDISSEILGISPSGELRKKEFWAVNDVSFELRRGECLGLIGHNGAGKSTLLKMLNGLIKPDKGRITMKGRIGALIELGAGFNPILTGRENIYNNGAVLGFSKKEIDKKLEAIIDFAEIDDFVDTPVQNYSSGMKVRLGFAVAAQMEPDVLLIDEVLAVGDIGFRIKCLNKINELLNNTSVIFVSHTMPQVARVCNRVVLMERGNTLIDTNNVSSAVTEYLAKFKSESESSVGDGKVALLNIAVKDRNIEDEAYAVEYGEDLPITFSLKLVDEISTVTCKIFFVNQEMRTVLDVPSELNSKPFVNKSGKVNLTVNVRHLNLNPGKYGIALVVQDGETQERLYRHNNILFIKIFSDYVSWSDCIGNGEWEAVN